MQPDRPSDELPSDDLGGRPDDTLDDMNRPVDKGMALGRSEDSPGHRKQAAGAQSARDFAPGRARRA